MRVAGSLENQNSRNLSIKNKLCLTTAVLNHSIWITRGGTTKSELHVAGSLSRNISLKLPNHPGVGPRGGITQSEYIPKAPSSPRCRSTWRGHSVRITRGGGIESEFITKRTQSHRCRSTLWTPQCHWLFYKEVQKSLRLGIALVSLTKCIGVIDHWVWFTLSNMHWCHWPNALLSLTIL